MYRKRTHGVSVWRKVGIAVLSGIMVASLGLAAACSEEEEETTKTTTKEDTQTILNGNFEFFDDSDDNTYIIYTPDSWTSATSGRTNYVMNGILDTSASGWAKISDDDLAATLDYNNSLDEDDDDYDDLYVDYNGMRSRDIPYKDTYNSLSGSTNGYYIVYESDDYESGYYILVDDEEVEVELVDEATGEYEYEDDDGETVTVYDKLLIDNPLTHNVITDNEDGTATYTDEDGNEVTLYVDDDGNYYYDEELTEAYESHVLMIHNYVNNSYGRFGTAQSYSSSTTITLEPNTAAEISVWVKTSNLIYHRNGSTVTEDRGAYISVTQTVGGTEIDATYIKNINTDGITENNGWVQFTVFVQGCDFSSSEVSIELGLGLADDDDDYAETLEGYAFFDDVTCTLYSSLDKSDTYSYLTNETSYIAEATTCSLDDDGDEKVFNYDTFKGNVDFDDGYGRYFLIDLSSGASRTDISVNSSDVSIGFTKDDDYYISSEDLPSVYGSAQPTSLGTTYYTNRNLKLETEYDVLATFTLEDIYNNLYGNSTSLTSDSYNGDYYSTILDIFDVWDDDGNIILPQADENTTGLILLSSYGAAYTAEITSNEFFVGEDEYVIVSFWVKTSDLKGLTAATINIVDASDDDISATMTVDTTDVTFDVGDEKDIYNGWVQCFFYVHNTTEGDKTFKLEFSFGNTTIKDTSASDYMSGYAAITNITTFNVSDEIFSLASTGDYAVSFEFDEDDARENAYMDTVYGTDSENIKTNISRPSSYNGVNGGSANVVYNADLDYGTGGRDALNDNSNAGLINKDYLGSYLVKAGASETSEGSGAYSLSSITADKTSSDYWLQQLIVSNGELLNGLSAALTAEEIWSAIFGTETIQPLLIVNTIRTFSNETSAINYGYIASSATEVSSSTYQAITVRVKVSAGAVAYIYLTDENYENVTEYTLPKYSFWYDSVGNVLDGEPDEDDDKYDVRDHIVYYLRDDGLYEDANGDLYANLWNYSREYFDESVTYWAAGATEATHYNDIDSDTVYYISQDEAEKAASGESAIQVPHYLITDEGTRVFYYGDPNETGEYGYYYIVTETDDDDEVTVSYTGTVSTFVIGQENGGVDLKYDNTENSQELYVVVDARYDANGYLYGFTGVYDEDDLNESNISQLASVDVSKLGYDADGNYIAGTWQYVTFYIHTGDEAKSYTLELWSGARDSSGVTVIDGTAYAVGSVEGSYVIFDYSSVTIDEDSYDELLNGTTNGSDDGYVTQIKNAYIRLFNAAGLLSDGTIQLASNDETLAYYQELYEQYYKTIKENVSNLESNEYYKIINSYTAVYYTYSLYDDEGYVPFNYEIADDDETGYDYAYDDYSETLVYLSYKDTANNTYSVFVDYSATDVSISTSTSDGDSDDDDDTTSGTSVWLLISSIVLVVVLIFTLISLLIRDILRRRRRNKNYVKNVYRGKRRHFIRKLGLTENAPEETPDEELSGKGFDGSNPDWSDSDK